MASYVYWKSTSHAGVCARCDVVRTQLWTAQFIYNFNMQSTMEWDQRTFDARLIASINRHDIAARVFKQKHTFSSLRFPGGVILKEFGGGLIVKFEIWYYFLPRKVQKSNFGCIDKIVRVSQNRCFIVWIKCTQCVH